MCFFVACHSHATPSPLGASSSKPALSLSTDRVFVGWKREETEGKRGTVCVVPRVRPDAASPRAGTAGCASIEMGPRRRVTEGPLTLARSASCAPREEGRPEGRRRSRRGRPGDKGGAGIRGRAARETRSPRGTRDVKTTERLAEMTPGRRSPRSVPRVDECRAPDSASRRARPRPRSRHSRAGGSGLQRPRPDIFTERAGPVDRASPRPTERHGRRQDRQS